MTNYNSNYSLRGLDHKYPVSHHYSNDKLHYQNNPHMNNTGNYARFNQIFYTDTRERRHPGMPCTEHYQCKSGNRCVNFPWTSSGICRPTQNPYKYQGSYRDESGMCVIIHPDGKKQYVPDYVCGRLNRGFKNSKFDLHRKDKINIDPFKILDPITKQFRCVRMDSHGDIIVLEPQLCHGLASWEEEITNGRNGPEILGFTKNVEFNGYY
jgi:hypothetical protein